jgi:hypothetical protein
MFEDETASAGPGITGAKTVSWEHYNPRDLVLRLIREYPGADDKTIARHMRDAVLGDESEYLLPCLLYVVRLTRRATEERPPKTREEREERSREHIAKVKERVTERVREEAEKMLLDLKMPNGKPLRDCTGSDSNRFGGRYQSLAVKVGPRKRVGDVLSEQDVRELYDAAA